MGMSWVIEKGDGHRCRICGEKITKSQKKLKFTNNWDCSAIVHSDSMDCDKRKRLSS